MDIKCSRHPHRASPPGFATAAGYGRRGVSAFLWAEKKVKGKKLTSIYVNSVQELTVYLLQTRRCEAGHDFSEFDVAANFLDNLVQM